MTALATPIPASIPAPMPAPGAGATAPQGELGAWFHDLSPWVWQITETLGVRWYGLSYFAGFVLAYLLMRWLAKRGATAIPLSRVADAIMVGVLGVVVGGRLGYILFYDISLLGLVDGFPYWGVLAINRGGMASHGGMIGVVLAAWRISRGFKLDDGSVAGRCPPLHAMDVMAMIAPFGLFLGRIANFVNAELLGRIVARAGEPAPWWSVRYPQEILQRPESELLASRSIEQWGEIQRLSLAQLSPEEQAFAMQASDKDYQAIWHEGYARVLERLHGGPGSEEIATRLEPLIAARAPSQLVQALCEGVILALVVWFVARRPRLPGVVGCWWLITYGTLRLGTEFLRLPDAHLEHARTLGLTRGQWLSSLMIVAGGVCLAWVCKKGGERLGGWARPGQASASPVSASS